MVYVALVSNASVIWEAVLRALKTKSIRLSKLLLHELLKNIKIIKDKNFFMEAK